MIGVMPRVNVWCHIIVAALFAAIYQLPADASERVTISVHGTISPSCTLDGSETTATRTINVINLDAPLEYEYRVNCNTPFKYNIVSDNGALQLESGSNSPDTRIPYDVSVRIPTDDVVIEDHCQSEAIKIGQNSCALHHSRNGIAIDSRAKISVQWKHGKTALHAGTYSDRLTFSIGIQH